MATQMVEYAWSPQKQGDPSLYEYQAGQSDKTTAEAWVVHFQVKNVDAVGPVLERLRNLEATGLTGEYMYGDSWKAWGETPEDDEDKALHVYFKAQTPDLAAQRGMHIANHAYFSAKEAVSVDYAISTAGDWAEQLDT